MVWSQNETETARESEKLGEGANTANSQHLLATMENIKLLFISSIFSTESHRLQEYTQSISIYGFADRALLQFPLFIHSSVSVSIPSFRVGSNQICLNFHLFNIN